MEWLTCLLPLGLLGLVICMIGKRKLALDDLPRIRGLPLIGNLHQVNQARPELTFTEWSKDLGGIFGVKLLFEEFVVLNSQDTIHEALVQKKEIFAGRPEDAFRLRMVSDGFQDITFSNPRPVWHTM